MDKNSVNERKPFPFHSARNSAFVLSYPVLFTSVGILLSVSQKASDFIKPFS